MKRIKDSIYWSFASQECSVVSTHFATRWPCFHRRGCGFSACGGQDTTGTTDTAKSAQKHLSAMRMRAAWASGLTLTLAPHWRLSYLSGRLIPVFHSAPLTSWLTLSRKKCQHETLSGHQQSACLFHCKWADLFVNMFTRANVRASTAKSVDMSRNL